MKNSYNEFDEPSINTWHTWRPLARPMATVLIAAQIALALQPLSVIAQEPRGQPYNPHAQAQLQRQADWQQRVEHDKIKRHRTPADLVGDQLVEAQDLVSRLRARDTPNKPEQQRKLNQVLRDIEAGVPAVRSEFNSTRAELKSKSLPAEILARHDEAAAQLEQRVAGFIDIDRTSRSDEDKVERLAAFFEKHPSVRKPIKRDPKKLPWSTPQPVTRPPAETQTAWFQHLYGDQKIRLAQAGGSIGPLQFTAMPDAGQAPTPPDLAETDEVQLTPSIRGKAQELGNNPVAIYNWVRNNIEWVPTAGAIQSAQDTLDKRRGNATDTASLLIALLRAANIPARYQWGTIEVAADKAMNWVGGVTKPEAAQQLIGQGGIANRALVSGGSIVAIRMEHVWVQAYVNWTPSRGSRDGSVSQHPHPNAALNAWVPLDASFKQYSYSAGMNLGKAVPLDGNALLDAAKQGATVNEAEGWVQNLNQVAVQNQVAAYQSRLKAHVEATATGAGSTAADVVGRKVIPQRTDSLLAGVLPNAVVAQSIQASAVPATQQHKFTYQLYADQSDQFYGGPLLTFTEKTSRLVRKRLMLTYVPASQADADVIASYLPKPRADGSPIPQNEVPTSLPAYLIRLKARITLDGVVVAQSEQPVQMGADLYSTGGFTQLYDCSQWDLTNDESNVAGQATAVGISAGGISAAQMNRLKERLREAQGRLNAGDTSAVKSEQLTGDLLTAALWTWFAATETQNRLGQVDAGMVENPGLSYGLFHAVANPSYSWGVIRRVTFPGVTLDIGHVRALGWAKDNDATKWINYNRFRGQYMSSLEHDVPERFFSNPSKCNPQYAPADPALPACRQGVSAMKALAVATGAGQKIYTITRAIYQANSNVVNSGLALHSASTRTRVQQALDAGHEVTIHEKPIALDGWAGAGYTIIDPETGAGGYLIEGGANGGSLMTEEAANFILNVLSELMSIAGNALKQILGTFLSLLLNLLDAYDIFEKCTGAEAIIRPIAFLIMAIGLSALFGFGLAGLPFILILLGVLFLTLVVNAMKDAFLRCR